MSSPTRWAGVPLSDRRAERRALLVDAAYRLFGDGGATAVSVRSVCRESGLNSRYFYDSFGTTDDLLAAVYDLVMVDLGEAVAEAIEGAGEDRGARTKAGVRAVLGFSSEDPRRGRVLFTDARAHPVMAQKLEGLQGLLYHLAIAEDDKRFGDIDPRAKMVGAALFTGAMTELVIQWLTGKLGDDLDAVIDYTLERVMAY